MRTHYLLIHFDIPRLSAERYSLAIGGRVRTPARVSLADLKSRSALTQVVTMECAGTGRSTVRPRAVYVPWSKEAIGTYQWTGTPLRPILEQAGLLDDAVEVLFRGCVHWRAEWDAGESGDHMLACRATDEAGNVQPLDPQARWNRQGMGVNGVQRLAVTVRAGIGSSGQRVLSNAKLVVSGAEVPERMAPPIVGGVMK